MPQILWNESLGYKTACFIKLRSLFDKYKHAYYRGASKRVFKVTFHTSYYGKS